MLLLELARRVALLGSDNGVRHPSDYQALQSVAAATYLVDPASSHMLVSKINPCMSKYKLKHSETANESLNQLWFLRSYYPTWIIVVILELIHDTQLRPSGKSAFVSTRPIRLRSVLLVTLTHFVLIARPHAGDVSFKCLPYQLSMVRAMPVREREKRLPHPRKAAGAQITQSRHGEVVTKNNNTGVFRGPVIGMNTL